MPNPRRPSQRYEAPPPGTPSCHPHGGPTSLQERVVWGRYRAPMTASPGLESEGNRPELPTRRMGSRGRVRA